MKIYKITYSKLFKKQFKKLQSVEQEHTLKILERLANDEILEPKYQDHALKGKFSKYRDCRIKPDLVLVYEKMEDTLILKAIQIANHNNLFKK